MNASHLTRIAGAAGILILSGFCASAAAQVGDATIKTAFATGFEPPAYVAGPLDGQDKWAGTPFAPPEAAVIQGEIVYTGEQALLLQPAPIGCVSTEWIRTVNHTITALRPVVDVTWQFMPLGGPPYSTWAVTIYDQDLEAAVRLSIAGPESEIYVWASGPVSIPTGAIVKHEMWNTLRVRLDYAAQTAAFSLNGEPVGPFETIVAPGLLPDGVLGGIGVEITAAGADVAVLDDLAIVAGSPECYSDCDRRGGLNVNDFLCFQNSFATSLTLPQELQRGAYANCDGSEDPPVLNINDYFCFMNDFVQGCK